MRHNIKGYTFANRSWNRSWVKLYQYKMGVHKRKYQTTEYIMPDRLEFIAYECADMNYSSRIPYFIAKL